MQRNSKPRNDGFADSSRSRADSLLSIGRFASGRAVDGWLGAEDDAEIEKKKLTSEGSTSFRCSRDRNPRGWCCRVGSDKVQVEAKIQGHQAARLESKS